MSICSYSTEYTKNGVLSIESAFITEYMPDATGDAVKVFLYGLYLCKCNKELTVEQFADAVNLTCEQVKDCFKYWEEYDIVTIISTTPFEVRYLPLSNRKPKKYKPEKYTEFSKALQALVTERMISTGEYAAYFDIMESYSIKPEAMLMICKYCIDLKGGTIGYKYISTVAKDFAYRGIVTVELIEKELNDYITRSGDITEILSALGSKRKPEIDDLKLFNKWRLELGFEQRTILHAAKKCKSKTVKGLDEFICELYANKLFDIKAVDDYVANKEKIYQLAKDVCGALSLYVQVLTPVVDNYLSGWLSKGYDGDTLIFLATYCFKKNRRTLNDLNDQVNYLYERGLITLSSIADYVKRLASTDEFIKKLLSVCNVDRRPTEWDRTSITTWQNWGFSEEMILEAGKFAVGKTSPIIYINAILSGWKAKGVYSPDQIPKPTKPDGSSGSDGGNHFSAERRSDDLNSLISNVDDINF